MNKINIKNLGFSEWFLAENTLEAGHTIGRVFSQYRDIYRVVCETGELTAEISGKFRFDIKKLSNYPAVGDFVTLDRDTNASGNAIIQHVMTRKSAFIRKAAGTSNNDQIVASNIDTVFICMSLNNDFNVRRLERYLSIAWDSRAIPVVVLTKSDLCNDLKQKLLDVNSVAIGVDILVTSSMSEDGYSQTLKYINHGQTVAFIGSSGVGKSSLINCLIGENVLSTKEIRNDDKGKHTTTRRKLILLANGGMVIDTPGMRELGLESANLSKTFSDIEELSSNCKFIDCAHTGEPGCAVQQAIKEGTLSVDRLASYVKLKKTTKYEGLNSKQIEIAKFTEMFSSVGGIKNARKLVREKNKKR